MAQRIHTGMGRRTAMTYRMRIKTMTMTMTTINRIATTGTSRK